MACVDQAHLENMPAIANMSANMDEEQSSPKEAYTPNTKEVLDLDLPGGKVLGRPELRLLVEQCARAANEWVALNASFADPTGRLAAKPSFPTRPNGCPFQNVAKTPPLRRNRHYLVSTVSAHLERAHTSPPKLPSTREERSPKRSKWQAIGACATLCHGLSAGNQFLSPYRSSPKRGNATISPPRCAA